MDYSIVFALTAEQDLREIAFHVLTLSKDLQTAQRFVEGLRVSVQHLTAFPQSGEMPKDRFLIHLGLRYVIQGDYLVFYKAEPQEKRIYIVAVLNGKTDHVKTLKSRL